MSKGKIYGVSFFCYYEQDARTQHYQPMPLKDIPRWIEAYQFTHPDVLAISVKVWMNNEG